MADERGQGQEPRPFFDTLSTMSLAAVKDALTTTRLSVVTPAHNESENLQPLVEELERALTPLEYQFEVVIVDDGSTDETFSSALNLATTRPWLKVVRMTQTPADCGGGQSAAFHAGIRASCGELIATIDADLQNDPADLPSLLEAMHTEEADLVQGDRSAARRDSWKRRRASDVGRLFRRWLLGDSIRDTGCSLRVMRREVALQLPLELRGLHRFIPVTIRDLGYRVVELPVAHRQRHAGTSKIGSVGITQRALPGLLDCFGVRWLRARRTPVDFE